MTKQKISEKGFTLMEFLIYIGIVTFLITAITFAAINILNAGVKMNAMHRVSSNGETAMDVITKSIRGAKGVNSAGSSLSLETHYSHDNPTVFTLSDGQLKIKRGSDEAIAITDSNVEVTSLSFSNPSSRMVEIEVTIENVNEQGLVSYDFEKTFSSKENIRHRE
jgi:Tfp pilus assembly protein PilW